MSAGLIVVVADPPKPEPDEPPDGACEKYVPEDEPPPIVGRFPWNPPPGPRKLQNEAQPPPEPDEEPVDEAGAPAAKSPVPVGVGKSALNVFNPPTSAPELTRYTITPITKMATMIKTIFPPMEVIGMMWLR